MNQALKFWYIGNGLVLAALFAGTSLGYDWLVYFTFGVFFLSIWASIGLLKKHKKSSKDGWPPLPTELAVDATALYLLLSHSWMIGAGLYVVSAGLSWLTVDRKGVASEPEIADELRIAVMVAEVLPVKFMNFAQRHKFDYEKLIPDDSSDMFTGFIWGAANKMAVALNGKPNGNGAINATLHTLNVLVNPRGEEFFTRVVALALKGGQTKAFNDGAARGDFFAYNLETNNVAVTSAIIEELCKGKYPECCSF